jgi:hypothetical protein
MAREIPEVVRAAAGLAATVLDEARKLPETLPGLPVRLIGLAMQHAMKVQQQYAGFVARGDELFTGLRGEDEPGLATFDDDEPQPATTGFRESAFDRAGDTEPTSANVDLIIDEEVATAQEAPDSEAILDEIAIDELVDQAPTLEETAPATPSPATTAPAKAARKAAKAPAKAAKSAAKAAKPVKESKPRKSAKASRQAEDAAVTEDAAAVETALLEAALAAPGTSDTASPAAADTIDAEPTADVATTVDVLTPSGDVAAVDATVTDEGVTAPETPEPASAEPASDTATATDEGGTPVATEGGGGTGDGSKAAAGDAAADSSAPRNAPVDGYDAFTVAQLRGRLRGYALRTVEELVAYEQATRARAPYLTMLRNRLEKLEEQAIESSPLAPRGA